MILTALFLIGYFSCTHRPFDLPAPVVTAPASLTYSPSSIEVKTGYTISSVKPVVGGTQPMSFFITTSPYSGGTITINNLGIITIDSTASVGTYTITITATNSAGSTTFNNVYQITVSKTINPPTELTYASDSLTISQGSSSITSAPPIVTGTHPIQYTVSSVPSSDLITINDSTGAITVDSSISVGTYVVTVTAANAAGTKTFNSAYTVVVKPVKPSDLVYAPAFMNVVVGNSATSAAPVVSGTRPITCELTSNPSSGFITIDTSGKITAATGLTIGTYIITVTTTNEAGSVSFPNAYTIQVDSAPKPPSQLNYSTNAITLNANQGGNSVAPTISGTTPISYFITTSPATSDITVNSSTGVITAAASLPIGTYVVNVTATNAVGSQAFNNVFTITVVAVAPSGLTYSPNTLTIADDVTGTSAAPTVTGTTPIAYVITTSPVTTDISVNSSTGIISVPKLMPLGTYNIVVNATNQVGSTSTTYTVTVVPSYTTDIHPIMIQYCISCHNQYNGYNGTKSDITGILQRVQLPSNNGKYMPPSGTGLSTEQINLIKQWQSTGMKQ